MQRPYKCFKTTLIITVRLACLAQAQNHIVLHVHLNTISPIPHLFADSGEQVGPVWFVCVSHDAGSYDGSADSTGLAGCHSPAVCGGAR